MNLVPVFPDDHELLQRPKVRSDCASIPRPCPFVSCQYNNYLDIQKDGTIKHLPMYVEEMDPETSCALDAVGPRGGMAYTDDEISVITGIETSEVRVLVDTAIRRLRHYRTSQALEQIYSEWGNNRED